MAATVDAQNKSDKSDFVAAAEIKGILQGREKAEQERIIRWASESLNLVPAPTVTGGHVPTQSLPSIAPVVHAGHHGTVVKKDIKTFVEEKKPKSAVHFVAVVAYFHHFESAEQKEEIAPDDVQDAARLAGWNRFKNPASPLNNAVTLGYLDRAGKGTFKINAVGENLVAMALPGTSGEGNGVRKTKKKAVGKKPKKQLKK